MERFPVDNSLGNWKAQPWGREHCSAGPNTHEWPRGQTFPSTLCSLFINRDIQIKNTISCAVAMARESKEPLTVERLQEVLSILVDEESFED